MIDEERQKYKEYQKNYRKNMSDEQKQHKYKKVLYRKKVETIKLFSMIMMIIRL